MPLLTLSTQVCIDIPYMRHKSLKLIKTISLAIALVFSLSAFAGYDREDDFSRDDRREIGSIQDLLPEVNNLNCQTKCVGQPGCGDFKDMDSCLDQNAQNGCFWSCD